VSGGASDYDYFLTCIRVQVHSRFSFGDLSGVSTLVPIWSGLLSSITGLWELVPIGCMKCVSAAQLVIKPRYLNLK